DKHDQDMFIQHVLSATDTGQNFALEFQTVPINDVPKIIFSQWKCQLDEHDLVYQLFGIFQDITDRKIIEEVLKRETIKADQANQAKSIFLSNMSHEIRTPMNAILGFSEILYNEVSDESHHHYLEIILNSGRSLLKIINDILDLSKVESGKLTLEDGYFCLRELIKDIILTFTLNAQSKKILLLSDFQRPFPAQVKLDKVRVRQILVNLISNALKFTEEGSVTVLLEYSLKRELTITVKDTGIGIAEDQVGRVFEEFEQTQGQSFEKYGGTGLGLSITKKILELMKGEIKVSSKLGEGSEFTLKIPNVESLAEKKIKEGQHMAISDFSNVSILIVDKTLESEALYNGFLKYSNAKIDFIQSCQEVVPTLLDKHFHIVLIDKKGFSLSEINQINLSDSLPAINRPKMILVSASNKLQDHADIQNIDDHLLKPISQTILIESLNELLGITAKASEVPAIIEDKKRNIVFSKQINEKFLEFLDGLIVDELQDLIDQIQPLYLDNDHIKSWCEELSTALSIFDIDLVELLINEIETKVTD
ncbi:ATP-binding protein, partial [bacterium]|nr:ATP-binding protein [bacterium]